MLTNIRIIGPELLSVANNIDAIWRRLKLKIKLMNVIMADRIRKTFLVVL